MWHSLSGTAQWRIVRLRHATFLVGVTGVVRDAEGRVLLLRHRFWPESRPWGLPTGYAEPGETFEQTVAREVREETGLEVKVRGLVRLRSGFRLRLEVAYDAEPVGGTLRVDPLEILEAAWFALDALPPGLQDSHRALILDPQ
ncbi:hypothetical protein Sru01_58730 [Sphaerisporangium rufum]|uniref:Nudix hydrolase domain-containing protein n=1 Tax=Sphaerisporangium rufum TaxID=1381558 RepID=A0A919V1A1_9ACTN|nr:NUDIX domain-containing protein [Sphaerisporangium rufum]GII80891.1 hypothetical protein Sru01_58730 [Sphaerisporangium rufum]